MGFGGDIELEVEPPKEPGFYYECKGCDRDYIDISDIDIDNIRGSRNILYDEMPRMYGKDMSLEGLLRHRLAIVKVIGGSILRRLERIFKGKIVAICIYYNNIRSFLTFTKKKSADGEYYLAENLARLP